VKTKGNDVPDIKSWRKSSRSTETDSCVEVANTLGALRDSKNAGGPRLTVPVAGMVALAKAGHLDR
jgi:Domain of unknown function (DUF397)